MFIDELSIKEGSTIEFEETTGLMEIVGVIEGTLLDEEIVDDNLVDEVAMSSSLDDLRPTRDLDLEDILENLETFNGTNRNQFCYISLPVADNRYVCM